jgi:hypothetical protein
VTNVTAGNAMVIDRSEPPDPPGGAETISEVLAVFDHEQLIHAGDLQELVAGEASSTTGVG